MSNPTLEALIVSGDAASLKSLLIQRPDLATVETSFGVSPLLLACYYKRPELVSVLSELSGPLNLYEAAATGDAESLTSLLFAEPASVNRHSPDGFTALGLACYFGREEAVKILLSRGADCNICSQNGFDVYPLHSAAASGSTAIASMLLHAGAQVNVRQQAGITPLHSAAESGNIELIILLLEYGAATNVQMEGGKSPADLALDAGHQQIAKILTD
ncbi:ankyrin repeat domain-containing protein [Pedobacter sp. SYP-B3415]|uniref:ankyrin repeat domain-containing protein n=1 Tax=Pedobacter sp. SYP-B3415 TaxID=2496641 RepID=UPI00101B84E4|nr:ankyrin repeat domain-containing protein [Pedobacter sp. SYP-B3415]